MRNAQQTGKTVSFRTKSDSIWHLKMRKNWKSMDLAPTPVPSLFPAAPANFKALRTATEFFAFFWICISQYLMHLHAPNITQLPHLASFSNSTVGKNNQARWCPWNSCKKSKVVTCLSIPYYHIFTCCCCLQLSCSVEKLLIRPSSTPESQQSTSVDHCF